MDGPFAAGSKPRHRAPRPRRSRRIRLLVGLVLLVALAVMGDAYYQSFRVAQRLEALFPGLQAARSQLIDQTAPSEGSLTATIEEAAALRDEVDRARFTFRLADSLPLIGRPVRAARLGATAAFEATRALSIAQQVKDEVLGKPGEQDATSLIDEGVIDLEDLEGLIPRVDAAIEHLEAANHHLEAIPPIPFVDRIEGMKASALAQGEEAVRLARRARSGLALLPSFLGADEPRTYFLALQNNADQRATGGAALAYGLIEIEEGAIELVGGGSVPTDFDFDEDGNRTGVPVRLPPQIRWYLETTGSLPWVANLNYTPDFPVVANTWARQIARKTGEDIAGVIALDQVAISYLLRGQPAITVPSYPDPIDADNVVFVASNDQYRLPFEQQSVLPGELVAQAFGVLTDPENPTMMVQNLSEALAQKRIQIWSARPEEQEMISEMGWDGALKPTAGDYLFVTNSKRNAGKQDYYLRKEIDYTVRLTPSGDARATARVHLRSEVPREEPRLVAGDPYGMNTAMLNVYVPRRASKDPEVLPKRLRGRGGNPIPRRFVQHVERDWRVYTMTVKAWRRVPAEALFSYRIPGVVQETSEGRVYELTVQHQPMVQAATINVEVVLPSGATVKEAGEGWSVDGRVARFKAELTRDVHTRIVF